VKGLPAVPLPLFAALGPEEGAAAERGAEPAVTLPLLSESQEVVEDYRHLALTLRAHPLSFLRDGLAAEGLRPTAALADWPAGRRLATAGLVLVRQRPGSAKGVIFATLEDETGIANVVVWPQVFERHRRIVLGAALLGVAGRVQREGLVVHLVAEQLFDLSERLRELEAGHGGDKAADFERALARADEVKRPGRDQRDPARPRVAPLQPSRDFH